jgi:hypothetical protein
VGANSDQGSAYVFTRSGNTWTQEAKLTAGDGAAADQFGYSVALDGDTALIGAYADNVGANRDQGSAYVFTRSGTAWTQQVKLTAGDGAAGDFFGNSVALDVDTAMVGATYDKVGANDQGSAYVFTRSGTMWMQQAKLTAADGARMTVWLVGGPRRRHRAGGGVHRHSGCQYRSGLGLRVYPQRQHVDATGEADGGRRQRQ